MSEIYNKMKYFENIEKISENTYYHYTSLDSFYSIITSKTFRLTSLKSSNDKTELYYKPDNFLLDFANVCSHENSTDVKKILELISDSIEHYKKNFLDGCKKKTYPYALCLSEKRDNLTHWDRYAVNSTGVCIGFNISSLSVYMQRMAIIAVGTGLFNIGKVYYSSDIKEENIKKMMYEIINALLKGDSKNNIREIIKENGYIYAMTIFRLIMQFSKNSSFVDEDEIRLYHDNSSIKDTQHLIDDLELGFGTELCNNLKRNLNEFVNRLHLDVEKFCMTPNGIRSYKELCLEEVWGSGTIPEIILGPRCIQNKNELKRFLRASGLEGTKVTVSKVPIR